MCCTIKRLYNLDEAAVYVGRSEKALRELVADGKIPVVAPDGRRQIDKHDLDKWIEENKRCLL